MQFYLQPPSLCIEIHGTFKYSIVRNVVLWMAPTPTDNFLQCISSYQYFINSEFAGEVMGTSLSLLDMNDSSLCNETTLIIYPVVRAENSAQTNINASGTTCSIGESITMKKIIKQEQPVLLH